MLGTLAAKAAEAGAGFLYANVLFLSASSMKHFMPFLERDFPHLVHRYQKLYARSAYLHGEYPEKVQKLVGDLRTRYGLDGNRGEVPAAARHPQLSLQFGGAPAADEAQRSLSPCRKSY